MGLRSRPGLEQGKAGHDRGNRSEIEHDPGYGFGLRQASDTDLGQRGEDRRHQGRERGRTEDAHTGPQDQHDAEEAQSQRRPEPRRHLLAEPGAGDEGHEQRQGVVQHDRFRQAELRDRVEVAVHRGQARQAAHEVLTPGHRMQAPRSHPQRPGQQDHEAQGIPEEDHHRVRQVRGGHFHGFAHRGEEEGGDHHQRGAAGQVVGRCVRLFHAGAG